MRKHFAVVLALVIGTLSHRSSMAAVIELSNSAPAYSEDFNSLAASLTSSSTPTGWSFAESGSSGNNNGLYSASTGSSTAGDTYSFGTDSDRAFGELTTGTLNSTIGAQFRNTGSTAIQSLSIGYDGEQWRLGAIGRTDRLDFQYSLNATSLITGTWTDLDALDFESPFTSGPTGALNGNLSANRLHRTGTATGLSVAFNEDVWIRWLVTDVTGADDGLAIDDFTLAATFAASPAAVPEPGTFALLLTGLSAVLFRRSRAYLL